MKVLVACEFSGIVRRAFEVRGHDAWSCDLLESERPGNHIVHDAVEVANDPGSKWDLVIAHPPCTYLCNSGVRWLKDNPERWMRMYESAKFFRALLYCRAHRCAVENPIPHGHAKLPRWTQKIQPFEYGHGETKATCLWLRNLPTLVPTNIVEGRTPRVHHASPGPERWKERSRTMQGIADAMAAQWGSIVLDRDNIS